MNHYAEFASPTRRARRNVMAGEHMLTPRIPFVFEGETYKPNITRIAVDHPAAAAHPDDLMPAYERESGAAVLEWLERREDRRSNPRRRAAGREPWRLS